MWELRILHKSYEEDEMGNGTKEQRTPENPARG
jgi:hypothetical protein